MTREEKLKKLNDIYAEMNESENAVCYLTSDDNEVIQCSIKALENEEKLLKENRVLKNRCKASTQGLLCSFCPLECEQRAEDYKAESEG